MFVTNWISTTKIQKISEITNFFRHYFLSRTEVNITPYIIMENSIFATENSKCVVKRLSSSFTYTKKIKHWSSIGILRFQCFFYTLN